jgi:hypothetical protein
MVRTFCWAAASWQSNRAGKTARSKKDLMARIIDLRVFLTFVPPFIRSFQRKIPFGNLHPFLSPPLAVAMVHQVIALRSDFGINENVEQERNVW